MNYSTELNENNKTITVRTTGHLKTKEIAAMGVLIRLQARDLKYKLIFDYSLSKNFITITEAYNWFSDYYDTVDLKLREIPTAIIANKEDYEFFDFYETTCNNRGIPIKIFSEDKSAMVWLEER